jgi:hypothetical protein
MTSQNNVLIHISIDAIDAISAKNGNFSVILTEHVSWQQPQQQQQPVLPRDIIGPVAISNDTMFSYCSASPVVVEVDTAAAATAAAAADGAERLQRVQQTVQKHIVFPMQFDLRRMPFDVQLLPMSWRTLDPAFQVDRFTYSIGSNVALGMVEFDMLTTAASETTHWMHSSRERISVGNSTDSHYELVISIPIQRRLMFHVLSTVLPLFFVGTIALSSFFQPVGDDSRIDRCISLFLLVLVMMTTYVTVMRTGYISLMFWFYFAHLLWLFVVGCILQLLNSTTDSGGDDATTANRIAHLVCTTIWLFMYSALYAAWSWTPWLNPKRMYAASQLQRQQHRQQQQQQRRRQSTTAVTDQPIITTPL